MPPSRPPVYLAPGAPASGGSARLPGADQPLPPVDERLVAPETRFEIVDGQVIETMPCDEPHGTANGQLAYVLGGVVRATFRFAVDMLMRANRFSDFAPDASVYPADRDPETGKRQLEQLVFEIKDTQGQSTLDRKARLMVQRGVRRIFCVDVAAEKVMEWSHEADDWNVLGDADVIDDPVCLVRSLPVRALVKAAAADDTVASALLAKGNRVLTTALRQSENRGLDEGLRRAILDLCDVLAIVPTAAQRRLLAAADTVALQALRDDIKQHRVWKS